MEATGPDPVGDLCINKAPRPGPRPLWDAPRTWAGLVTMWAFVIGPFVVLVVAVPVAWGQGLSVLDATMAIVAYLVSGFGLTAGYHRLFTHRSFKGIRGCGSHYPSPGRSASRDHPSSGSPTTAATTPSPTGKVIRIHHGGTAPARWPCSRACSTPTWAGCFGES